jgi:glycosyltransferase involved in cell wall biosynthesis
MRLVTVGIPVHNGGAHLHRALESVVTQTYSDLEILVADNHSSDETAEVVAGWARQDSRVRVISPAHFLGAAENFNFIARQARGHYFRWHAHDDLMMPDLIEHCVTILEKDAAAVSCHPISRFMNADGGPTSEPDEGLENIGDTRATRLRRFLLQHRRCDSVLGVHRTSELLSTGLIRGHRAGDEVLMAELTLRGRIRCTERVGFCRRTYAGKTGARGAGSAGNEWFDPANTEAVHDVGLFLRERYRELIDVCPMSGLERVWVKAQVDLWYLRRKTRRMTSHWRSQDHDIPHRP